MAIQGLRHTENFATDERPLHWRAGLLRLYPNGKAPLFALTTAMKERKVDDPEYNWWEKQLQTQRMALSAAINNAVTTIPVTSGALQCKVGTLILIEASNEIVRVTANPTVDTSLTVVRAQGGTTAAAVDPAVAGTNPNMFMIGSMHEENSGAPPGVNYDPVKNSNYTQIFRDTLEMSRTAERTRLRTVEQVKEAKRETLEIHGMGIEKALIFGGKSETTINGNPARSMGGVISFIQAGAPGNIVNVGGAPMDMDDLEEHLYKIFLFGSSEKVAFCGNRAALTINKIIRKNSQYNIQTGVKEYGMNVWRLVCPFGELVMKSHPLFNQLGSGNTGGTAYWGVESWMLVLDMDNLQYVYLDDTKYEPKLQDNDIDGMKSGYLTECGLEVHHAKTHYLLKGVAAAAIDS